MVNHLDDYRLYPRKRELQALDLRQGKQVYDTTHEHQSALHQWDYFREWRTQSGVVLNASSLQAVSVRVHSRPTCSLELDRDLNAPINILKFALNRQPGSGGQALM